MEKQSGVSYIDDSKDGERERESSEVITEGFWLVQTQWGEDQMMTVSM